MKTYLGVDVGSISTNLVLINKQDQVLVSIYLRTEGDPISAVKKGLREIKEQAPNDIKIAGVGTTGSARQLAGVITGADLVKNEITSHAKGASYFVPEVRTVIEIGGQDSKIIILEDGVAVDFGMNNLCLSEGTKITTNPSYAATSIEEMKVGQKVLTKSGKFRPVKQVYARDYQGKMIKLKVSNQKKLKLTPNHPILALPRKDIKCYQSYSRDNIAICKPPVERNCNKSCKKHKKFSWEPKPTPAKELRKGDFIATPIPSPINNIENISYQQVKINLPSRVQKKIKNFSLNPDLLRILGYYLAEGSIFYNRSRKDNRIKYPSGVAFSFNLNEKNYTQDLSQVISREFPELTVKVEEHPDHHTRVALVYSRRLAEFVKYLCNSEAENKKLAPELLSLKPSLQKEILRGFFRGDGQIRKRPKNTSGVNKKGNRYVASTVSEVLAYQLYWLLLRNRIKCTLRKSSSKTKGGKYAYFVSIHGTEVNKLTGKKTIQPKKQGFKSFLYSKWLFEPITEIERCDFKGEVYNLKVEEDHSYVANFSAVKNCAAGTGSFLDNQAKRLELAIEKFGKLALKSEDPTTIASRCTVFAESDMIHKQQVGHSREDIVAGLCQGLARNYLSGVGKGKDIRPPIVFQGGVSENKGMIKAFEEELGEEIIVPKYNKVMGAFGVALLVKEQMKKEKTPSSFRGWKISDKNIKCTSFNCNGCPNRCEVIEARIEGKVISRWGDRCGKWSNLEVEKT